MHKTLRMRYARKEFRSHLSQCSLQEKCTQVPSEGMLILSECELWHGLILGELCSVNTVRWLSFSVHVPRDHPPPHLYHSFCNLSSCFWPSAFTSTSPKTPNGQHRPETTRNTRNKSPLLTRVESNRPLAYEKFRNRDFCLPTALLLTRFMALSAFLLMV